MPNVWAVIIFIYWHDKLIPSLESRGKNDYFSVGLTKQSTTVLQGPFTVSQCVEINVNSTRSFVFGHFGSDENT